MILRLIRFLVHALMAVMPKRLFKNSLSCKEVAYLLATEENWQDQRLKKLRIHLLLCEACDNYAQQLKSIKSGSQKLASLNLSKEQLQRVAEHKNKIKNIYLNRN